MTTSPLLFNFAIDQLKDLNINILSVFNDKLLISREYLSQLFIYNREGRHLSTITINDSDQLHDATWTPRGNIVYATWSSNKVVVMSESGKVISTHTQMAGPGYLSVSSDGIIYLADSETGVYQSTDDGISWSLIFKSTDGWHCNQVIKVTIDHCDDFWTLGTSDNDYYLRVYTVDRRRSDSNLTWKDLNFTTSKKHIDLSSSSSLSYDGNKSVFLSDFFNQAVHVLSVNGQYNCQLLSSHNFMNTPLRLAIDKMHQLLYVAQSEGVVGVFKLTNRDKSY